MEDAGRVTSWSDAAAWQRRCPSDIFARGVVREAFVPASVVVVGSPLGLRRTCCSCPSLS
jgi:hypothetical protein